jgi:acetyl-CoA carboxylase carboxyl transferase subunit alpha
MNKEASRWVPFEKPLQEIEQQIAELESFTAERGIDRAKQIKALRQRHRVLLEQIYANLSPWDKVLLARHPARPYTLDYVRLIFDEFMELRGDRAFGDDPAMVAGFASLDGKGVAVVGQQKGRDVRERQQRNFGCARPEGYRKALRIMRLAEKFSRPVVSFVDTPAAESREDAESRGIAQAIARNLAAMSVLQVPIVVAVVGEGGSGGAIGIGVGDRVIMLEHSIYSVIPPEGCAAILSTFGTDASRASEAAQALRLTAQDALGLGVVDEVVPEPLGGAHRDPQEAAKLLKQSIVRALAELSPVPADKLVSRRYDKFRRVGVFLSD